MIVVDDPDDPRVAAFRLNERGLTNRVQRRDDGGDGLFMAEGDLVVVGDPQVASAVRETLARLDVTHARKLIARVVRHVERAARPD